MSGQDAEGADGGEINIYLFIFNINFKLFYNRK